MRPLATFVSALLALGAVAPSSNAMNGLEFWGGPSNCFSEGCADVYMGGGFEVTPAGDFLPFTTLLNIGPNVCVRIEASKNYSDLEAVLIAPDGTVWLDDNGSAITDGNGTDMKLPLLKVITPVGGQYVLQISQTDAKKDVPSSFMWSYGVYIVSSLNCAGPSQPVTPSS